MPPFFLPWNHLEFLYVAEHLEKDAGSGGGVMHSTAQSTTKPFPKRPFYFLSPKAILSSFLTFACFSLPPISHNAHEKST